MEWAGDALHLPPSRIASRQPLYGRTGGQCPLARTRQKLFEERKDFLPAVLCLLRPIVRAVPREECVSRAVVTLEFVVLAEPLQRRVRALHVVWRGVGILIT